MPEEIHSLQHVDLRTAWPDEARDFTPWLANRLDRVGAALEMELELEGTEVTVPLAGRIDIIARQAQTGAKVVIENQLEESDDSHCLRLLGYAASADAYILVWVAKHFTAYHRSILNWVNEADTIDVYAVTVRAYLVGNILAADFRTVVEPSQPRPGISSPAKETWTTRYGDFYRPLVARLGRSGVHPVGKGGYRGRWRSFQTGYPSAIYSTALNKGQVQVHLVLKGTEHRRTYDALIRHRAEIGKRLDHAAKWHQGDRESWVRLETEELEAVQNWGGEEELEAVRERMVETLLRLRDAVQPYLDQVMEADENDGHAGAQRTE